MRQSLIKVVVPLVAGALVLASLSGAAFANAKHQATAKPTFDLAYEGPLSGGNAQLGLNMAYAVQYAVNEANSGKSAFGNLPFKLVYIAKDDQRCDCEPVGDPAGPSNLRMEELLPGRGGRLSPGTG